MRGVYENGYFNGGTRFNSVNELMDVGMNLDKVVKVPLTALDFTRGGDAILLDKWEGIMNVSSHEICAIASEGYHILQHSDCVLDVAKGMQETGYNISGSLFNYADSITMRFLIEDIAPVDDGSEGISIGCEIRNSYDKSSSFRGSAFMIRKVCSNGMIIRNLIPDVNFSIYHTRNAKTKVLESIGTFATGIADTIEERLGALIESAKETEIEFESVEKLTESLGEVFGAATHAKNVVDMTWDGALHTNRWDIYNAVTEYVSHSDMTPGVRDRLTINAGVILDPREMLVVA